MNVRGLGDFSKRPEDRNFQLDVIKKLSIYFLQEAHCTESNQHDWKAEWSYQALFSCLSSKKADITILFNNNFNFLIQKSYSDPRGRFIICDLTTNGKHFTLANLYAPNEDDPHFFADVSNHLLVFKCDEIVIGGDFNLVLDVEKDKDRTHKKSLEVVKDFRESLDLIDAWRVLQPDLLKFTWHQRRPEVHCRLDFFLVSQSTFCNTIDAEIIPGYKTDHSLMTINVSLHSNNRGHGFLKLNTSLLKNTEYVALIKSVINKLKTNIRRMRNRSQSSAGDGENEDYRALYAVWRLQKT